MDRLSTTLDPTLPPAAVIVGFSLVFLSLVVQVYNRVKPYPLDPSLPGPKRYFFLGIVKFIVENYETLPDETLQKNEEFQRTWGGPVPCLGTLPGSYFSLTDPQSVEYVLSGNFSNYEKGDPFRAFLGELLGNGIFGSDGNSWYRHRKIASKMFSNNLLREFSAVTLRKLKELSVVLSTSKSALDIQDLFFRMTFDTTSLVSFGVEYSSLRNQGQHPFALAFDEMQKLLLDRFRDPLFAIKRALLFGQRERRIRELKIFLDNSAQAIIRSRRRTDVKGLGPDLLSRFIDYATTHDDPISDEELRDVTMNFLVAGRDTTACALSWAVFELTRHPEVVAKIVQEVEEICGKVDGQEEADYSYDTIGNLEYTHAVVLEVLRLHPSVPMQGKYAIQDDVLPDGTFIPAKALITYSSYALGRSTRVWGDDADQFKPERFLGEREPSAFTYTVFNAGRRFCLGKPMAINTMKLTLAYLVPRFNFRDKAGHPGKYIPSLVLPMAGGFTVEVSPKTPKKNEW